MRRSFTMGLAVLMAGSLAAPALADERVRVETQASHSRLIGNLVASDDEQITIEIEKPGTRMTLPRASIRKLEVSRGKRSRGTGVAVGALVGAGLGAVVFSLGSGASGCSAARAGLIGAPGETSCYTIVSSGASLAGLGAGLGALLGAGLGAAAPPGERWERTPPMTFRLSTAPPPGKGVYAQLRVGF